MKYSLKFRSESFSVDFDCPTQEFYKEFFRDFVTAYYFSAKKPKTIKISSISLEFADLIKAYYETEKVELLESSFAVKEPTFKAQYESDPTKHVIMFTSGKDSLHLLLRLIEEFGKDNVLALYCKNINRSENYYETRSIKKICEKLGVQYKLIKITNSIKLNRTNHNIGLREQLTLGCAIPYIMNFKASKVWYGVYRAYDEAMAGVFSHHKSAFEIALRYLNKIGINIEVSNHIDYPIQNIKILEYLIKNHREIFFMSSSCYAQLNFREMHHKREQSKYPHIELYKGCGICLKCLIANGGIHLFDKKALKAPDDERKLLQYQVISGYKKKHPSDGALKQIHDLMTTGTFDSFIDR